MTNLLTAVLTHPLVLSASQWRSDDYYGSDEGGAWFWLLGPIGGIGFYTFIFLRYRNTDKRHAFEHESATEMRDLRTHDQRVDRIRGTTETAIRGRNSDTPLKRLGSGTSIVVLPAPKPPVVEAMEEAQAAQQATAAEAARSAQEVQPPAADTTEPKTGA